MKIQVEKIDQKVILQIADYLLNQAKTHKIAFEIHTGIKQLFYYADTSLSFDKEQWIIRKRNTVRRFETDILSLNQKNNGDTDAFISKYGLSSDLYTLTPGAIPVFVNDSLLIIVSVTGLSPQEDHQLALEAIESITI